MPEQRIGVVGGTGAVGTVTLALLEQRGYDDVRVFASARSAGKTLGRAHRRGGDAGGARARRRRRVPLLGRHVRVTRARPPRRQRRRGRDRQVLGVPTRAGHPARRARGERRARPRARRHHREPELLHDPAHGRAQAAARRGRARPRACRDLPVRLRRRRAGDGAAAQRAAGRARPAHGLGVRRRGVRRGVEAPRRDAEDHGAPRAADPGDVRARSGDGRARRGDLGRVRGRPFGRAARASCSALPRRSASRTSPRRGRPPARTRCWSAGSGATRRWSAASRCSSRATTSARAPR